MLQRFKTLPVAAGLHRDDDLPDAAREYARDSITLGWEERLKVRGRRTSDGGVEFGTALPRGTMLRSGDCFVLEPLRLIVHVVERSEPVFVVELRAPLEWGLLAYHIGNRHQPIMITEGGIVCPDLPGVEQLLQQCGVEYVRSSLPFTPATAIMDHRH